MRVRIDPNIRVRGGLTFAGFEDVDRPLHADDVGLTVEVYEPESNLVGPAVIERVDAEARLVYLAVAWDKLREQMFVPSGHLLEPWATYQCSRTEQLTKGWAPAAVAPIPTGSPASNYAGLALR